MNRREALQALIALPAVSRISKADLGPNDVIVLESDTPVSVEMAERIKRDLRQVWPDNKAIVLDRSLKMKIVKQPYGETTNANQ